MYDNLHVVSVRVWAFARDRPAGAPEGARARAAGRATHTHTHKHTRGREHSPSSTVLAGGGRRQASQLGLPVGRTRTLD